MLPIGQKSRYNTRQLAQYSKIVLNCFVQFATNHLYVNGFFNGFVKRSLTDWEHASFAAFLYMLEIGQKSRYNPKN